jgi:hypothetical protein
MSALIMGFAWGMAGLTLVGIGVLADTLGMKEAIGFLLYLPVVALVLSFFLPGVVLRAEEMGPGVSDIRNSEGVRTPKGDQCLGIE